MLAKRLRAPATNVEKIDPSIDMLARFELAHLAGKRVSAGVFQALNDVAQIPVQISLIRESIHPFLFNYLERINTSHDSYGELRTYMSRFVKDLSETPCRPHLTPLIDGIYVGEPKHLYVHRIAGDKLAYAHVVGFGTKVADVTFLEDVRDHIRF